MSSFKGWLGEKKTAFRIWLSLSKNKYTSFHNVIFPSSNGTTQIDHIIVSQYGVFIVETKNKSGWIFGSERNPKWTQVLYRNNYPFQNPLRQTFRQKKTLAQFLSVNESNIFTIIYFNGSCEFKTLLPDNVLNSGLARYIKNFKEDVFSSEEVNEINQKLKVFISESKLTNSDHIRSLNERLTSTSQCPNCGSRLVPKTARRGLSSGSKFLGCEDYPKCRFTRSA